MIKIYNCTKTILDNNRADFHSALLDLYQDLLGQQKSSDGFCLNIEDISIIEMLSKIEKLNGYKVVID